MLNLIIAVNWSRFFIVIGLAFVLALVFAVLILLVNKFCQKEEDETLSKVTSNLAGANCGGCGFTGCEAYAKALIEGKADLTACGVTKNDGKKVIAEILGLPFSEQEEVFAVVKCGGGINSGDKFKFVGNTGCVAECAYFGGRKNCSSGCLGDGSCVNACPYGALSIENDVCVANKTICQACKVCVNTCPKHIIELIPKTAKVYIACSSNCKGKEAMQNCKAGCIGCGLCAKNCPEGAITMLNNLPVIDYKKCSGCKTCVAKCPRKSIREI